MNKIFFVSGLPRSGSTLLMNILGQNPKHAVTPTDGSIELFLSAKNAWKKSVEFQAEGLEIVKPKVQNAISGMMHGYFQDSWEAGKEVAFSKSRGWLQYIEYIQECLKYDVKVIVTTRDVRALVSSFEKVYRKRGIEHFEYTGDNFYKAQSVEGRGRLMLQNDAVLGLTIARIRDALRRCPKNLIIVPYYQLVNEPVVTMKRLHEQLEIDPFKYDFENVVQVTHENDLIHGMDLHSIKQSVRPSEDHPWENILSPEFCKEIESNYSDINSLSIY